MSNIDMILNALRLQRSVNDAIDPEWMDHDRPYLLAATIEIGELASSAEVVWWAKSPLNKNNMVLECGDIMAFMLSHQLRTVGNIDTIATTITDSIVSNAALTRTSATPISSTLLSLAENIRDIGLVTHNIQKILYSIGHTMEDLMLVHKHKSMLNIHRAKYGYGVGIYTKVIDGVEDNEALRLIIENAPKDAGYESHFEELVDLGYASNNTYFVKMTDYCENNSSDVTEEAVLFRRKIMDTYIELISDVLPDNTLKNTDSMFGTRCISTYTRIRSNPKLHKYQAYMDTYIYLWGLTYLRDTVHELRVPTITSVKGAHRYGGLPIDGISVLTGYTDQGLTDIMFRN